TTPRSTSTTTTRRRWRSRTPARASRRWMTSSPRKAASTRSARSRSEDWGSRTESFCSDSVLDPQSSILYGQANDPRPPRHRPAPELGRPGGGGGLRGRAPVELRRGDAEDGDALGARVHLHPRREGTAPDGDLRRRVERAGRGGGAGGGAEAPV